MGNYSKHVIEVQTKFVTVNGKSMIDSKKTVEGLGRGVTQTTTSMRDWDSEGMKMISTGRTLTKGFQKFQMENLGVMFAGMALNRTMSTLNATSREWLGIGELTSTMMGITMLDANMDLLQFGILPLFDALTNLPPAAQKAIGLTAIALEGLGGVMMVGGQFMLGLDSTATLLAKVAGVRPEIIFSSKGLSALKTNLAPIMKNLGTAARYAGTGIAIAMAISDLSEGDVTGAITDGMIAAGFYYKNGWLLGAGIVLKMANEGMLADWSIKFFDIIGFASEWASDTLEKAVTFRGGDIDFSPFMELFDDMDTKAAERVLSGDAMSAALINRVGGVQGALDILNKSQQDEAQELQDKYDLGVILSVEELNRQLNESSKAYDIINTVNLTAMENSYEKIEERGGNILDNLLRIASTVLTFGTAPSLFSNWADYIGGKAVGGNIGSSGSYYLHEGETVLRKDESGNQSGNITVTYNVNVSDKREFEQMLRANNDKLTADVRRMSKV